MNKELNELSHNLIRRPLLVGRPINQVRLYQAATRRGSGEYAVHLDDAKSMRTFYRSAPQAVRRHIWSAYPTARLFAVPHYGGWPDTFPPPVAVCRTHMAYLRGGEL